MTRVQRRRRAIGQVVIFVALLVLAFAVGDHEVLRSMACGAMVVPIGELIKLWRDGRRERPHRL